MQFDRTKNKATGNKGEQAAAEYLILIGYKILKCNLRLRFGEIDILASDRGTIVVVEVKSVRGSGFGLAQDLVRYKKQQKLRLLARAMEQRYPDKTIRVDVIGVQFDWDDKPEIEHLKNVID